MVCTRPIHKPLVQYRLAMPSTDGAPLYSQIAAAIRAQISDGTLPPGGRVPSESVLTQTWHASRTTIRQALDELRRDGLVVTQPQRGTYVRQHAPVEVRHSSRYRRRPAVEETSPFARDARREGAAPDWTWNTMRIRADQLIADRLQVAVGSYVMQTIYVFFADGRPVQSSISWEPHDLVGGTAIEEPEGPGKATGVIARMDSIGVHIDRVSEVVHARPATAGERSQLLIPDLTWVQIIERTHWVHQRPVETADITIPADRYALHYDILID